MPMELGGRLSIRHRLCSVRTAMCAAPYSAEHTTRCGGLVLQAVVSRLPFFFYGFPHLCPSCRSTYITRDLCCHAAAPPFLRTYHMQTSVLQWGSFLDFPCVFQYHMQHLRCSEPEGATIRVRFSGCSIGNNSLQFKVLLSHAVCL